MDIVREKKSIIAPMVTEHWKNKFEKSIPILLKSGYTIEELIEKIKEIALLEEIKQN